MRRPRPACLGAGTSPISYKYLPQHLPRFVPATGALQLKYFDGYSVTDIEGSTVSDVNRDNLGKGIEGRSLLLVFDS